MNPTSVTVDRSGNLYVGDAVHQHLAKFSPGGRQVARWDLTEQGATVDQVVVRAGPAGNMVIVMVARVKSGSEYLVVQRRSPGGKILTVWRLPNHPPFDTGETV
jgi:hypothetical protein